MTDIRRILTPTQLEAVTYTKGPLLVIAGAGSGKTRVLTYRVAFLVKKEITSPRTIAAVTFTRKAAREMRGRLRSLVRDCADDLMIGTIHSVCYWLLRSEADKLGYKLNGLSVYDELDAQRVLRDVLEREGLDRRRWAPDLIWAHIQRAKDRLIGPDEFVRVPGNIVEDTIGRVYGVYQRRLRQANTLDYADLIQLAVKLLRQDPEILEYYRHIFDYVLVDEFQDLSNAQYELLRLLVEKHRHITCVGSPTQAIYGWRGADLKVMLRRFLKDFPDARILELDQNFRSTRKILAAAQAVAASLTIREKDLWTSNEEGLPIALVCCMTDWDEAVFVAQEARRLHLEEGIPYREIAVLYRTRAQGRLMEQVFMHLGIAYTLVGEFRFFKRREIQDVLAYLRLAHNAYDTVALERVINKPPRGLGKASLGRIKGDEPGLSMYSLSEAEYREDLKSRVRQAVSDFLAVVSDLYTARDNMGVPELMDYALERTGYDAWLEKDPAARTRRHNLAALRAMAARYEGEDALSEFLADIATSKESDEVEVERGVMLSTIHQAKGLEFQVVFVAGLEDGLLPHARSMKEQGTAEEERRLCYVAITRARKRLYLVYAQSRQVWGDVREYPPSRFLADVPREVVERRTPNFNEREEEDGLDVHTSSEEAADG